MVIEKTPAAYNVILHTAGVLVCYSKCDKPHQAGKYYGNQE
jgi:hypothetical protein